MPSTEEAHIKNTHMSGLGSCHKVLVDLKQEIYQKHHTQQFCQTKSQSREIKNHVFTKKIVIVLLLGCRVGHSSRLLSVPAPCLFWWNKFSLEVY